jgi:hypothetical protein
MQQKNPVAKFPGCLVGIDPLPKKVGRIKLDPDVG